MERKELAYKVKLHAEICNELNSIYNNKNNDYGDAFGRTFEKLGLISAVTRISDKYNRLESLATSTEQKVKDESIEDTLMDMANYCIMTIIELRKSVCSGFKQTSQVIDDISEKWNVMTISEQNRVLEELAGVDRKNQKDQ
jgi:hypothetical protein